MTSKYEIAIKWSFYSLVLMLPISLFSVSCSSKTNTSQINATDYEENDSIALAKILEDWPEESDEERFEYANPWRLNHFKNEWGEENPNAPFLSTNLQSTPWDINLDFVPSDDITPAGSFRLYIMDSDGMKTDLMGPVSMYVRGADGETYSLEITGVRDGIVFIEDPATVIALKEYLNNEEFDFRLEFEKYLERHSTQGHWSSTPGFFQRAVDKLL
ncbi:MAG: hypothetical protein K2M93_09810 [Muribaculaceae bacterium]|nr:hypothetical protein [Muribaculaceae bacterium]